MVVKSKKETPKEELKKTLQEMEKLNKEIKTGKLTKEEEMQARMQEMRRFNSVVKRLKKTNHTKNKEEYTYLPSEVVEARTQEIMSGGETKFIISLILAVVLVGSIPFIAQLHIALRIIIGIILTLLFIMIGYTLEAIFFWLRRKMFPNASYTRREILLYGDPD